MPAPNETWKVYYYAGAQLMAMRVLTGTTGNTLYYLHSDHLGSTSVTTSITGTVLARQYYTPYGSVRSGGGLPTDIGFTGQRAESGLGSLMYFRARFYSPLVGRFVSADSIVPGAGNPQSLNRYSYTLNNPLKYIDPTGHGYCDSPYALPEDCAEAGKGVSKPPEPPKPPQASGGGSDNASSGNCRPDTNSMCYGQEYGLCLPGNVGCSGGAHYADWWLNWYLPRLPDYLLEDVSTVLPTLDVFVDYWEAAGNEGTPVFGFLGAANTQFRADSARSDLTPNEKTIRAIAVGIEDVAVSGIASQVGSHTAVMGVGLTLTIAPEAPPAALTIGFFGGFTLGYGNVVMMANQILPSINQNLVFPLISKVSR
jgi:RHS repeat-associated protein